MPNQQVQKTVQNVNQPQPTRQIVNNLNQHNYQSYPQTNMQQPVSNQMIPNQIYQNNQLYNGQYNVQPQNKVQFGPTNVS